MSVFDENHDEVNEMVRVMLETQRLNSSSVNKLSRDTKEILEKLAQVEWLKIETKSLENRIIQLERQQIWFTRLILTIIISGILTVFIGVNLNKETRVHIEKKVERVERKAKDAVKEIKRDVERKVEKEVKEEVQKHQHK
jgi:hypothetical protein